MSTGLPGWTCPALDRLAASIRRHVPPGDEQLDALIAIEGLRVAHVQLRAIASRASPDRTAAEVARLQERIDELQDERPLREAG